MPTPGFPFDVIRVWHTRPARAAALRPLRYSPLSSILPRFRGRKAKMCRRRRAKCRRLKRNFRDEEHAGLTYRYRLFILFSEAQRSRTFPPCRSLPIRVLVRASAPPTTRHLLTQQGRRRRWVFLRELSRHRRLLLAVASRSILRILGRNSRSMASTGHTRFLHIMGITKATSTTSPLPAPIATEPLLLLSLAFPALRLLQRLRRWQSVQ